MRHLLGLDTPGRPPEPVVEEQMETERGEGIMRKPDELIWVLPTTETCHRIWDDWDYGLRQFPRVPLFLGVNDDRGEDLPRPEHLPLMGQLFLSRSAAETNEDFLQPIPYVVMRQGGRLIRFRRLPREDATEQRLSGRTSIGVGGHLSAAEFAEGFPVAEWLEREIRREMTEEFVFRDRVNGYEIPEHTGWSLQPRFAGYLLDRRDPVGRVHLGLVYVLDVPGEVEVVVNSRETNKLRMEPSLDPTKDKDLELEGWSQLLVRCPEILENINALPQGGK